MSQYPAIVIRICHGDDAVDWNVDCLEDLTFHDMLEATGLAVGGGVAVPAFDYEDEDGDRITVRSDEEMSTMLHQYVQCLLDSPNMPEPLGIYPRVSKSLGKRNVEGLKVETKVEGKTEPTDIAADVESNNHESPMNQDSAGGSSRKRSGDINEILACGAISQQDLSYLEMLGSGNCGTVYKALHVPSSTTLAVKVIPTDCSVDTRRQIIAELEILYRCDSPHVISFYGAFFIESRISICTEYMDGGSLDIYGKIDENVLGPIAVSVVQGLQYLWSLKIMHRDVKPSNVLVNTTGLIKLCDFGVSVQLVESIAKTFIGTNAYMAPEKIGGQDYRVQSEVWSLGISLFEMAVGRFPYESANTSAKPLDLLSSIVEKEPPRLPSSSFSDSFRDFVASCMQKVPAARPAPQALMRHPYIEQYIGHNHSKIIAQWIRRKLQEKSQSHPQQKTADLV